jgi:hypothetical protein
MINKFNKQLIKEHKKIQVNKFDEYIFYYKKILREQQETPSPPPDTSAPAPTLPTDTPPPSQSEPKPDIPMEKSYTDLLIIIAKALKVSLTGSTEEGTSNFKSYEELKRFAETWIARETDAEQISDSKAVLEIDKIQQHLNNILGSAEEAD